MTICENSMEYDKRLWYTDIGHFDGGNKLMVNPKVYFDNCCLNRPYDNQSNNKVRMESESILSIIDNCETLDWQYFSSDVLFDEILEISDPDKKEKVMLLYNGASEHIGFSDAIYIRAKELESQDIKSFDALHLASAESANADVLLTTNRKFINSATKANTKIPVRNPLVWLAEVLYDSES